jgi:hypothetical protein
MPQFMVMVLENEGEGPPLAVGCDSMALALAPKHRMSLCRSAGRPRLGVHESYAMDEWMALLQWTHRLPWAHERVALVHESCGLTPPDGRTKQPVGPIGQIEAMEREHRVVVLVHETNRTHAPRNG